ncbi:hypothetical protein K9N50_11985 [bacterium]|nr:hypothetical protein [bacterium]
MRRWKRNPQSIICSALFLIIFMLFLSCEGPSGPDGDDAYIEDPLSPEIEWLNPTAGDTIIGVDTLRVSATDNVSILRMAFFIAGREFAGKLVDSTTGLYELSWNTDHWPSGPYPLMARVWDEARNDAETPVIIVHIVH